MNQLGKARKPVPTPRAMLLAGLIFVAAQGALAAESAGEATRKQGMKYYMGDGVAQDNEKAIGLLAKAVKQGDAESAILLGKMYEFGMGTSTDPTLSASWYIRGAELGSSQAQFQASIAYYKGTGVTRDAQEAVKWWTLAMRCPRDEQMFKPSVESAEAKLSATEIAEGRKRADAWLATRPAMAMDCAR